MPQIILNDEDYSSVTSQYLCQNGEKLQDLLSG